MDVAESIDSVRGNDIANVLEDADCLPNLLLKDHLLGEDDSSLDPEACRNLGRVRVHQSARGTLPHVVKQLLARLIYDLVRVLSHVNASFL